MVDAQHKEMQSVDTFITTCEGKQQLVISFGMKAS